MVVDPIQSEIQAVYLLISVYKSGYKIVRKQLAG